MGTRPCGKEKTAAANRRHPSIDDQDNVAIFGLFGKKDNQPAPQGEKPSSRSKRPAQAGQNSRAPDRAKEERRSADRAATAKKIDAIESEMSSEFSPSVIASQADTLAPQGIQRGDKPEAKGVHQPPPSFEPTLPAMGMSTDMLLGEEGKTAAIEVAGSGTPQAIEEAAILYANEQAVMAEQLLQEAVRDEDLNKWGRAAWWMLFDLYQITGKQHDFEALSIDYAGKFETSPPAWNEANQSDTQAAQLDGSIIKLLERAQKLGESSRTLRLEFGKVTGVDPIGCGLLLRILHKLQSSEHDLVLVGASELADKIRAILEVGRRDETEAPWLLLMEILRLLNREKDFEDASMDYCVTFEVSPPAFVPPKNQVTTASDETGAADTESDGYMMPAVIDGKTDQLIAAINAFSTDHNPVILDCSRLNRIDFTAAGQLLSGLAPITCNGKSIEFHQVNHLIYALFTVIGLRDLARIVPRKL
jgi:ABC-type transporter Mla MlaB component